MKVPSLLQVGFILLICMLGVGAVTATQVDIYPTSVAPGETITVDVTGLPDGSKVQMDMEATINEATESFDFNVKDLVFPINLYNAEYRLTNKNTLTNKLFISNYIPQIGVTQVNREGPSSGGIWTSYVGGSNQNDITGTFSQIRVTGTLKDRNTPVTCLMQWTGTKQASPQFPWQKDGGPDDFTIPFAVNGIEDGSMLVTIYVDDTEVLSETITVQGTGGAKTGNAALDTAKGATLPAAKKPKVNFVSSKFTPVKYKSVSLKK